MQPPEPTCSTAELRRPLQGTGGIRTRDPVVNSDVVPSGIRHVCVWSFLNSFVVRLVEVTGFEPATIAEPRHYPWPTTGLKCASLNSCDGSEARHSVQQGRERASGHESHEPHIGAIVHFVRFARSGTR